MAEENENNISYSRQSNLFNPEDHINRWIQIIGAGTSGSWTALALCKLGLKRVMVYDFDKVEDVNIPSQVHGPIDLEKYKTEALQDSVKRLTGIDVYACKKYTNQSIDGIVIICVDTMKERKRIHKEIKKQKIKELLIIDSRIGGSQLEIYTCQSLKEWEKTFTNNPSQDVCGERSICYIGMITAGLIANQVKRCLNKESISKSILLELNRLNMLRS